MTDQYLRAAERAAAIDPSARVALLRARVRAGETVSLTTRKLSRPAHCHDCDDATDDVKHGDHVVSWGAAPLAVLTPVWALVGEEVSRAVVPHWNDCSGWSMGSGKFRDDGAEYACYPDTYEAPQLVRAIARLATDLPPVTVEERCPGCRSCGVLASRDLRDLCHGTGKRTHVTPGDRYLLAAVATAAARAALPVWEMQPVDGDARGGVVLRGRDDPARRAIRAAEAWLACPCPERERMALDLLGEMAPSLPTFATRPLAIAGGMGGAMWEGLAPEAVEAAARLTDVRPAIRAEVLARTGAGSW